MCCRRNRCSRRQNKGQRLAALAFVTASSAIRSKSNVSTSAAPVAGAQDNGTGEPPAYAFVVEDGAATSTTANSNGYVGEKDKDALNAFLDSLEEEVKEEKCGRCGWKKGGRFWKGLKKGGEGKGRDEQF
ncbi:hypothetical protein MMC20_002948 [Loxospora ochrophaea]|nr:hypothetical protein [Loxospora ochrophaea]